MHQTLEKQKKTIDKPRAGDIVIATKCISVPPGTLGVIEGSIDSPLKSTPTCFRFSAHRDINYVSASGGPVPRIELSQLKHTGYSILGNFWRWKDGISGAGRGEDYQLRVPLWEWVETPSLDFWNDLTIEHIVTRRYYRNPCDRDDSGFDLFEFAKKFDRLYLSKVPDSMRNSSTHCLSGEKWSVVGSYTSFRRSFKTDDELDAWLHKYKVKRFERKSAGIVIVYLVPTLKNPVTKQWGNEILDSRFSDFQLLPG